ncbi:DNA cytosine methyltransferase [Curtobacterium sp. MCBA15_001]|uniref:DNA cytosine methyltransferase n=1 Tax=Curtobacterium sp. MCBA15_001 TaxID=1898731 RepID=UPI0008DDCABF|nr:DNA cytosine methyltransferase [Curtobacterium sp. MCBA15_001]OIH97901.1 DNA (cytosine-5-)-methyltransferase [Curtobacterium sp. MCBA15_001]
MTAELSSVEICAGAGGQASGLEAAGFNHELAVEIEPPAAATLRLNRPEWNVHEGDVREVSGKDYKGIDLIAGGVPCPPFSVAGKQLGEADERDLFPEALRLVREARPAAVMLENVKGLASARFAPYRQSILEELDQLGYDADWKLLEAASYGVPQLRPRFILVGMKRKYFRKFTWGVHEGITTTVGEALHPFMAAEGWSGADAWAARANRVAPTLVGGSKKHGGADLGPTRAKAAWLTLGVDGRGIADEAPNEDTPHNHIPRLTLPMAAAIQGFAHDWEFAGRKTAAYRQIGNAFPPPVAAAVGSQIMRALHGVAVQRHEERAVPLLSAVS